MARPKGVGGPSPTSYGQESENKRGRGPKPGAPNAGGPTKSFRHFLANLRKSAKTQEAFTAALHDPESRGFAPALRTLTDYDENKPAQKSEVKHDGKLIVVFEREGRRRTAG